MSKPIIVIGGGGHAGVVIDLLRLTGAEILGVADPELAGTASEIHGLPLLSDDDIGLAHLTCRLDMKAIEMSPFEMPLAERPPVDLALDG